MTALRWSRRVRLAIAAAVMVGASLVPWGARGGTPALCTASSDATRALGACLGAYARSGEDRDLAMVAYSYLRLGDGERVTAIANRLLEGSSYGDGHRYLAEALRRDGNDEEARLHATVAYVVHGLAHDELRMMRDALAVSQAAWSSGDFAAAQTAAEVTIDLARQGHDRDTEVKGQLARADALRRMGDRVEAKDALQQALVRSSWPCDFAWTHVKLGLLLTENADNAQAGIAFDAAASANLACHSSRIASGVAFNRVWLLRAANPAAALAILDGLDPGDAETGDELRLRGIIAGNQGDRRAAAAYLEAALRDPTIQPDWWWEIESARAELAELRGDPLGDLEAEQHYRRAIAVVGALRATAQVRSAFMVANHRAPYDELIALLAREGRWRDVVAVVLELDASDMLRATAVAPRDDDRSALTAPAPLAPVAVPSVDAVVAAWRGRDLVIVIAPAEREISPGHEQVVRVRIVDGTVTGEMLGSARDARRDADDLLADANDVTAARALGALIVPPPDGHTETLDVLAIDALGKVPLAALRDGSGALVLTHRPLARVLAIRPRAATPPTSSRAIVIADPRGDLFNARLEGRVVASLLGERAELSGAGELPATRARLEDARDAALLHVASHVAIHGRWHVLLLQGHDVTPAEIVSLGLAPRLAVLASCGSAAALDDEGWGSIAAALLESGTAAVIATDRSVRDAASFELVLGFYGQPDWRDDPARALARVQVKLAGRGEELPTWPAFGVLRGPPVAAAE